MPWYSSCPPTIRNMFKTPCIFLSPRQVFDISCKTVHAERCDVMEAHVLREEGAGSAGEGLGDKEP